MRFLHTADLHLGKRLNDIYLLEDQKHILSQIASIARTERVDSVLISGDVYQKASPDSGAMEVFNGFVTELVSMGKKVFVISGNHDSDRRISYFSSLLRPSGVYVSEKFEGRLQCITLEDEYGEVDVYLFPFTKPLHMRKYFPEEGLATYQQMTEKILSASGVDYTRRCVLLAHQYIIGAELSDSEELAVGGLDSIDAALFAGVDYVALGHIHKPQKVGRENTVYAGSPLKYSFSEVKGKKSVVIADLGKKGEVSVKRIPLEPLHEMREVRGGLCDILAMPYSEDYVRVTVTDEFVAPDAKVTVSTVFPNTMEYSVSNSKTLEGDGDEYCESVENKTVQQLFRDFFYTQTGGTEPDGAHIDLITELLEEREENAREAD